jgi:hypothetical protein
MEPSSALAATDPDRLTIQYFENGGANPQQERVALVLQSQISTGDSSYD